MCVGILGVHAGVAQDRAITGTVTSAEDGEVLPGVTVTVEGTTVGTSTGAEGNYELTLPEGFNVLVFSFIGFERKTVEVEDEDVIDVVLEPDLFMIDELVVTSFGVRQERRSLGYSTQELRGEDIVRSGQQNMVSALQGRVAGVEVTNTGGAPGQSARIVLRGITSLDPSADNQPLFVIDGVPIDNSTIETGTTEARFRPMSNRAVDINPDDIESINVLKGASATALYGVRAANGAVIIETRGGQAGDMQVDVSSSATLQTVNNFPDFQSVYGQGFGGVHQPDSFWPAWGARISDVQENIDPDWRYYNNWENAMETGLGFDNSVRVSGGTESSRFLASVSNTNQNGIIPNSDWNRTSVRLNGDLSHNNLSVRGSINYINSGGNRVPTINFMERLHYWSVNKDVTNWRKEDGTQQGYYGENDNVGRNAIYDARTNTYEDDVNRIIGNVGFNYQFNDNIALEYRAGGDYYVDSRTAIEPGPLGVANENVWSTVGGFIEETRIASRDLTSNAALVINNQWNDRFDTRLRVGSDIFERRTNLVRAYGQEFASNRFEHLSDAETVRNSQSITQRRLIGVYGDLLMNYNEMVYLNLTGRNDWSSTLPEDSRSFFYPSVNLGLVYSDMLELPDFWDYGQFRASWAQVGKDANPYSIVPTYRSPDFFPLGGQVGYTRSPQIGTPDLKPERTTSVELGTDMRMFRNRIGLDFSVYQNNSRDQIIPVPVSPTTGYSSFLTNAGEIRNRGIEVTLDLVPYQSQNFLWDVTLNWSTNQNRVMSITDEVDAIFIASGGAYINQPFMQLVEGESYGAIWGTSYQRYYEDGDGPDGNVLDSGRPILINDDPESSGYGFPVVNNDVLIVGDATPNWVGGITNSFAYRGFDLSLTVDAVWGADKYDRFDNWDYAFGLTEMTLDREDTKVFEGVLSDGSTNDIEVWLGQNEGPDGRDYGAGYHRNIARVVVEESVRDASYFKLRNITLGYNFQPTFLNATPLSNLRLYATANNIILWSPWDNWDPESTASGAGSNATAFSDLAHPGVSSFIFGLNFSF